jgi:hypothetical protein
MLMVATLAAAIGLAPGIAHANGGAYIEFDGTHHLPGEQVRGEVYVSIPRKHRDLLDRGPFYAYLLPGGAFIEEGRPIPDGAIRLGTFVVRREGAEIELALSFTVPAIEGDYYQVGMCNDPCTVAGFGETVSGTVSIVATAREASLLTDNGKLHAQVSGLKRDLRKAERSAEEQASVAAGDLQASEAARSSLSDRVQTLEVRLASEREAGGRPLIDPWSGAAIAVALLALAAVLAGRRRRPPSREGLDEGPLAEAEAEGA